jgi:hypothetical protein
MPIARSMEIKILPDTRQEAFALGQTEQLLSLQLR